MFKKNERLDRSEFAAFFPVGKRHNFPHLTIIILTHPTRKVGVVVGKKVAKSAVRRNALKRRIYALLRLILVENNYQGIFIVLVKPSYNSLSRSTAEELLDKSIAQVLKTA
jgi:ribonuclease P protein component